VCYYCQGVCTCASCRRRRAKETNTKFQSHRGKKRRSVEDESAPTKKRKFKLPEPASDDEKSKDEPNFLDILNSTIEQTPRRKLRKKSHEKPLQSSNHSSPNHSEDTYSHSSRKPHLSSRRKRVTLKDLIDSHILSSGDELSFRNSEQYAVLLPDGQILWSDITFKSLSTFAKTVAHLVGAGPKGALYNGWRVVYCRGKVMDSYRKKYERAHKTDEIEESSESDDENSLEENDPEFTHDSRKDFPKEIHESQSAEEISNSPMIDSDLFSSKYVNPSSILPENLETWWESDREEDYDSFNSGLFGFFDIYLNPDLSGNPEEEQDLLIMGNNEPLDIGDKDFFNMTEEVGSSMISPDITEGEIINTISRSSLNERVEDFYNGFDSDC
jgi:hypothetical protein